MALRIKSSQDFWTGCAFTAFGVGTVVLAQAHPMGSAARMGPAYFPTVLGALLAAIGVGMLVKSLASTEGGDVERVNLGLLVRVLLAVGAFAVLLNPLGLLLTTFVVVLVAASASHEFRFWEAVISAVVLTLFAYGLFVWALNQTMPVWPWFLTI